MSELPRPCFLYFLVALVSLGTFAHAQVMTFVWNGTGDWSTAARWTPPNVPGAGDNAQITAGTATVSDARSINSLFFEGGTINGGSILTLTGTASNWTSGTFSGVGITRIAAGAQLTLSGSSGKALHRADGFGAGGRSLENFGTITWTGLGPLLAGDGAQVVNQTGAVFDLQADAAFGHTGFGSTPSFTNAGTFKKSAGTGTFTVAQTAFTTSGLVAAQSGTLAFTSGVTSNGGTFSADTGSSIVFTGGQTFNDGTSFTGAGTIRLDAGTTIISGNLTTQNLTFAGGELQGSGNVTGNLAWTGGSWRGNATVTFAAGSTFAISGALDKVLDRGDGFGSGGRILENLGTITWTGAGSVLAGDGAQIINRTSGTFLVQNDSTLGHTGFGSTPVYTNQGTLRKNSSNGTTTVAASTFVNSGNVDVQTGTLAFTSTVNSNGGRFTAAAGANITFSGAKTFNDLTALNGSAGNIRIGSGDTTISGTVTMAGVEFAGGSLHGSAFIAGNLTWTGGAWRSSSIVAFMPGSTLTLAGLSDKLLDRSDGFGSGGRIARTYGTLLWTDAGQIVANDGAGIDILAGGLFELRNDSTYTHGSVGTIPFLSNDGTIRKLASAGTSTFSNVALSNSGRFEVMGGNVLINGSFGGAGLSNTGTVEVQAGTLTSEAAGRTSTGGTFSVLSGAQLRFTGGTNTIVDSSFSGAGLTEIAGGSLIVSNSTISGLVTLASGTIGGGGVFTVSNGGRFNWSGGTMNGTGTLAVATGGVLTIEGSADKTLSRADGFGSGGRIITNAGTVLWSGTGRIRGSDGPTFSNLIGGIFEAQSDAIFDYAGFGNRPAFSNAGTFRKTGGTGVTDLALAFTHTGLLESKSGTIRLSLGGSASGLFGADGGTIEFAESFSLENGARFLGPSLSKLTLGTLSVANAAIVTVGGTGPGNFSLEGGVLAGGGEFLIGSTGNLLWSGGALASTGTLRIAPGGSLDILAAVDHAFYRGDGFGSGGHIIDNGGTVRWSAGNIRGGDGASFVNSVGGLLEITGGGAFNHTGAGNTPTFTNAGTVRKTAGGTTTFSPGSSTTSGLIDVQAGNLEFTTALTSNGGSFAAASGTTLSFSGGQTFNNSTNFSGGGLIQATANTTTFNGAISADRFVFAGGSLSGTSTFTGVLEWTGGAMIHSATLGIPAGSTLKIIGTGDRHFYRGDGFGSGGRVIENFGTTIVANAGNVLGGDGGGIINRANGLLDFRNDQILGYANTGNAPFLINDGTLRKSAGPGTTTISSTTVTHSGLIEVQTGTMHVASGFTSNAGQFNVSGGTVLEFSGGQTFNTGTSFTGTGLTRASGGVTTLAGNIALANFEIAGGSLDGGATITGGVVRWTGGDWRGSNTLTIASSASLLITGTGNRTIQRADGFGSGGRIVENYGTMSVDISGSLLGNDGAQWINGSGGTLVLTNDASFAHGGAGNVPAFTNQGTLLKVGGTGTSTVSIPFSNTGAIGVLSGTLAFTSAFNHTGSSIVVANGAALSVAGPLNLGTASLAGTGTITATSVTAGGAVAPGNSAGTLNLTGNLTLLLTSHLIIELGGTLPGSGYDVLAVAGTAALAGNLHVSLLGGFGASGGDTFSILTSAGLSGAFANVANGQRLSAGDGSFLVNYGAGSPFLASSVVLSQFQQIPEPSTYVLIALGGALVFGFGRLKRRRR